MCYRVSDARGTSTRGGTTGCPALMLLRRVVRERWRGGVNVCVSVEDAVFGCKDGC